MPALKIKSLLYTFKVRSRQLPVYRLTIQGIPTRQEFHNKKDCQKLPKRFTEGFWGAQSDNTVLETVQFHVDLSALNPCPVEKVWAQVKGHNSFLERQNSFNTYPKTSAIFTTYMHVIIRMTG